MSDKMNAKENNVKEDELIGRVHNEPEHWVDQPTDQTQQEIDRVNNALHGGGQPATPPVGRTNNALSPESKPVEQPIGRINNELHKSD
ncbi:MAG TPA: hypothetical protein VMT46_04545 [Anaerolineaceae bacterium]|nr:hypothetical protein [Anaerolineaceae bacterium]